VVVPDPDPEPPTHIPTLPFGFIDAASQTTNFPALRSDSMLLSTVDLARADLAQRLDEAGGAPMLVTAEATPDAPGAGYDLVFRVGDEHYKYRAGAGGHVLLVDNDYEFDAAAGAWNAVESDLTAAPVGLAGDYNDDGRVDDADRGVWRANFGAWSLTTSLAADGNRDGIVDTADYVVWRANLGAVAAVASLAGDFDASGAADQADYALWQATFGSTADLRADGNHNGEVDLADYAVWRNAVNAIAASSASLSEERVADAAVMAVVRESLSQNDDLLLAVSAFAADDREPPAASQTTATNNQGDETSTDAASALEEAFASLV
jgi:hypothetical protein